MSSEKAIDQSEILRQKIKALQQQIESNDHQHKKELLEAKTELQFQQNRANQFEQKYKNSIRYKNEEAELKKILNSLDDKLSSKENQILALMRSEQEKNRIISEQQQAFEELKRTNNSLQIQLNDIKEAAFAAIVQKDQTITKLTEKIEEYEDSESINNLKAVIVELQDKYRQLEERAEAIKNELESIIEGKDQEISEYQQRLITMKEKQEERISRLEGDILQYQKHIEKITEEKYHEENLEEKYYLTEEKLRKVQKKLHDLEAKDTEERYQFIQNIQKLESMIDNQKPQIQELKELKNKYKELEKDSSHFKKQMEEHKTSFDRLQIESSKKYANLEGQKKIISQNLQMKIHEIDRLRIQIQEIKNETKLKLKAQQKQKENNFSIATDFDLSPTKLAKKESEDQANMIQKLKKHIKQLEQNIVTLNKRIEQQTKEVQETRQHMLSTSGSASRSSEQEKLLITIEDLNSHIKKVQNNLVIIKLKHAQDEMYWEIKSKQFKDEIDANTKQYKKDKSELLERIDRMKRTSVKDNKMDYYQSAFK